MPGGPSPRTSPAPESAAPARNVTCALPEPGTRLEVTVPPRSRVLPRLGGPRATAEAAAGPRRTARPERIQTAVACVAGMDIGTTGTKTIVFGTDGRVLGRGYVDYPLEVGDDGRAEVDSRQVITAAAAATSTACAQARQAGADRVAAIAIAAQGEGVTPVDARWQPLAPALLAFDRRGEAGRAELAAAFAGSLERAGIPFSFMATACKLAWLRRADPGLYTRAAAFLCFEDLMVAALTGRPAISDSLAQRTFLLDRHASQWDAEALEALSLKGRLAPVARSGLPVGRVGRAGAARFGLPEDCPVVAGAHDQTAALIGAGGIAPGIAAHSTGTVDCMSIAVADGPAAALCARGYCLGLHPAPGLAVTLAFGFAGGSLLAWWRDVIGGPDIGGLLAEAAGAAQGDAFAVPFWAGSGTPDLDAGDRGAFFGLTLGASRAEMTAALLRGISLEMRRNIDVLRELGVGCDEIRLVGGGARDPAWSQLRADVTGRPYTEMRQRDAGCLGAAVLAGVGAEVFADLPSGCAALVQPERKWSPDPEAAVRYDRLYPAYARAVGATRAVRVQDPGA